MSTLAGGERAFEIARPSVARRPLLAHVPHASTHIPAEVRAELLLAEDQLEAEILRLTDWYTDELFAGLRDHGATLFVDRLSRLVFDPERFLDAAAEPMEARGQGVVYWQGSELQPLREPSAELRDRRVRELYQPYHAALDALVAELLTEFGSCTVVDCHSFPSQPLRSEIDQAPDRPDICIGTDPIHTPPELAAGLERGFARAGLRVGRDTPFAGTFVPSGHYGREPRVRSVMIEVRRGLYIDEATAERSPTFDELAATISRVVSEVVAG